MTTSPVNSSNLNDSVIACNQCNLAIVDTVSDSIQCDGCDRWYHSWKECSGLKKTLFKMIRKNDSWACNSCIELCKMLNSQDQTALKSEMLEVRELNRLFFDENKKLKAKITSLEHQLNELKSSASSVSNSSTNDIGLPPTHPQSDSQETASHHSSGDGNVLSSQNACVPESSFGDVNCNFDFTNVHLIADSHGRRLREILESKLSENSIKVTSDIYPSAPMDYYTKNLDVTRNHKDNKRGRLNVIIGGVNDTSGNVVDSMINEVGSRFNNSDSCQKDCLVVVETPYRYDDISFNDSIKYQNSKLKELCGRLGWLYVPISFALFRMHYTRHGLHLNKKGKEVVCSLIADSVMKLKTSFLG
jgi:hypothetical protein